MSKEKNFNQLPKEIQKQLEKNSQDMTNFYGLSTWERNAVLYRISQMNSKEEFGKEIADAENGVRKVPWNSVIELW